MLRLRLLPMGNKRSILDTALHLLSYRAHSESELRKKLHRRGYNCEEISDTVNQLTKRGYINDAALCEQLFQQYTSAGKYGLSYIIGKLKQAGFADDILGPCINKYDKSLEMEKAAAIINKRFPPTEHRDMAKISRFLAYRGFSASVINKIVTNIK
jgi:regulatory protein